MTGHAHQPPSEAVSRHSQAEYCELPMPRTIKSRAPSLKLRSSRKTPTPGENSREPRSMEPGLRGLRGPRSCPPGLQMFLTPKRSRESSGSPDRLPAASPRKTGRRRRRKKKNGPRIQTEKKKMGVNSKRHHRPGPQAAASPPLARRFVGPAKGAQVGWSEASWPSQHKWNPVWIPQNIRHTPNGIQFGGSDGIQFGSPISFSRNLCEM